MALSLLVVNSLSITGSNGGFKRESAGVAFYLSEIEGRE
jgi:hypothetical protein